MVGEAGICHPSNTIDADDCTEASVEDLALADVLCIDLAENQDSRCDDEHDHLDDRRHGDCLHRALCIREGRQDLREVTEHSNDDDAEEEDVHSTIERARQFLILQRFRLITVYILVMSRIFDVRLENRIFFQVLAATIAPSGSNHDAAERSRDGDSQQIDDRERQACCTDETSHADQRDRYR